MQAVIFIGAQAARKSSFYDERFSQTHLRINLDMFGRTDRAGFGIVPGGCLGYIDLSNIDPETTVTRAVV